jgi:hypothetical protein
MNDSQRIKLKVGLMVHGNGRKVFCPNYFLTTSPKQSADDPGQHFRHYKDSGLALESAAAKCLSAELRLDPIEAYGRLCMQYLDLFVRPDLVSPRNKRTLQAIAEILHKHRTGFDYIDLTDDTDVTDTDVTDIVTDACLPTVSWGDFHIRAVPDGLVLSTGMDMNKAPPSTPMVRESVSPTVREFVSPTVREFVSLLGLIFSCLTFSCRNMEKVPTTCSRSVPPGRYLPADIYHQLMVACQETPGAPSPHTLRLLCRTANESFIPAVFNKTIYIRGGVCFVDLGLVCQSHSHLLFVCAL